MRRERPPRKDSRDPTGHQESHAGHRGTGVDEAEDWDALEVELAGDGWPYRAPNRGHLGPR